jgi:hypothetical protein
MEEEANIPQKHDVEHLENNPQSQTQTPDTEVDIFRRKQF